MELLLTLLTFLQLNQPPEYDIHLELTKTESIVKARQTDSKIKIVPIKDKKPKKQPKRSPQKRSKALKPVPRYNIPTNRVVKLINQYFGSQMALRIAKCESTFIPTRRNPSGACGVFQIMPDTWVGYTSQPFSKCTDAKLNIKVARRIYNKRGWQPWTACLR